MAALGAVATLYVGQKDSVPTVTQSSEGDNSPNVGNVGGDVVIRSE